MAAELQRGSPNLRFVSPELEEDYVRVDLMRSRTLIRVACTLAALLALFRGVEQAVAGSWNGILAIDFGLVVSVSILLAAIAWSPVFERLFLRLALIVVPVRNSIVAAHIAEAAAPRPARNAHDPAGLVDRTFFLPGAAISSSPSLWRADHGVFYCFRSLLRVGAPGCAKCLRVPAHGCDCLCDCCATPREQSRTAFLESRFIAELAQHDALTGTKNRRVFDEYLTRLWQQAMDDARPIAILLIDIDHFKAYNDRYGHQAGDQTLRRVAQTAQTFVRRPPRCPGALRGRGVRGNPLRCR